MTNTMCVYRIKEPPYITVNNVHSQNKDGSCFVEDVSGNLIKVNPLYLGPFDHNKFLQFSSLICDYLRNVEILQTDLKMQSCRIFDIDPLSV